MGAEDTLTSLCDDSQPPLAYLTQSLYSTITSQLVNEITELSNLATPSPYIWMDLRVSRIGKQFINGERFVLTLLSLKLERYYKHNFGIIGNLFMKLKRSDAILISGKTN